MSYVASNQIHIYPTSTRTEDIPFSRLTTEYNLIKTLTRLTDKQSFILDNSGAFDREIDSGLPYSDLLNFVIGGYAVAVRLSAVMSVVSDAVDSIYANLTINGGTTGDPSPYITINGNDDESDKKYKGINFTAGKQSNATFSLKILEKISNTWQIPRESLIRFTESSVCIDDGDLDLQSTT